MYTKHRILKIALGLNEQQYLNAYGNHSILDCTPSCKAWTHGTVHLSNTQKVLMEKVVVVVVVALILYSSIGCVCDPMVMGKAAGTVGSGDNGKLILFLLAV